MKKYNSPQIHNNIIDDTDNPSTGLLYFRGTVGAIIGIIPGIALWILITFLDCFGAGIMGFIIVGGALLGFKKAANGVPKTGAFLSLLITLFSIVIVVTSLEAYSLRKEYNSTMTDEFIVELKNVFIESLRSSGLTDEEINSNLKTKYNVDGLDDTNGINDLVKRMYDEPYMSERSIKHVPDTFINSYKCLIDYTNLNSDNTEEFLTNLIVGFAFAVLGFATISNSTFMNTKIEE